MHVEFHQTPETLKQAERVEKSASRAKRIRIVILAPEGWTAPSVAMAVGLSRRAVQGWVARYNADGFAGLDERRGNQAGLPLSEQQQEEFRRRLAFFSSQAGRPTTTSSAHFAAST